MALGCLAGSKVSSINSIPFDYGLLFSVCTCKWQMNVVNFGKGREGKGRGGGGGLKLH